MIKEIKFLLLLLLSMLTTGYAREYKTIENIAYSTSDNEYARQRCKLDIYHSSDFKDNPVVIWFHGGGLTGGEKFIPEELKNDSLVVVAVNYRLLPKASIDECIDDAAAAVAWTFDNISEYGGSPDKIFLAGHSAGGYLLSMVGLDNKWLEKYGVESDSIAGLFPYSGQVLTHYAVRDQRGISPYQPVIDEYAPLSHARNNCPPYVIISGDRNEELFGRYEENAYMWRLMKMVGHPYVYIYELDGYNHGDMAAPAHHILKNHVGKILNEKQMNAENSYPVFTLATEDGNQIKFTLFKHASLAVEYKGEEIYIDPVTKVADTNIDYSEMPKGDYILVTHEHGDHLDPIAINELSKPGTKIILNATSEKQLGKGIIMANNESMNLADGIVLESVPAYNTTPGREKFHPKGNGNGYILNIDGKRIYIAGDTEDIPEMAKIKDIDVAFLPVNQPYTMTIDQAEKAALTIKPKILIPYHFSDTPVKQLKDRLDKENSGIEVLLYPMQ